MGNDGNYKILITRDNKTLLSYQQAHDKNRAYVFDESSKNHLEYDINLDVKDNDYIFTYYGENGTGKTTIFKSLRELTPFKHPPYIKHPEILASTAKIYKIIDINMDLSKNFNSVNSFTKYDEKLIYFYNFFSYDNRHKIIEPVTEEHYVVEFLVSERKKATNIDEKFDMLNEEIFEWWENNNVLKKKNIYTIESTYEGQTRRIRRETSLYIIMKILEEHAISKKIPIIEYLRNFSEYKDELKEIDKEKLTIILNENSIRQKLFRFYDEIFQIKRHFRLYYIEEIKENIKIVKHIKNGFKKYFSLLSGFIYHDIFSITQYSSFLNMKYERLYVFESNYKPKSAYTFEHFINKCSTGQQKLLKFLFILAKIENADRKTIIIGDDIFDSSDNKNFMNIIVLLKKVTEKRRPIILLFTHEFEIFGMINKILKVQETSSYIMHRNKEKHKIEFNSQSIKNLTLEEYLESKIKNNNDIQLKVLYFLVLCIYGRNLVERTLGDKSDIYTMITSLLHLKKNSKKIMSNANLIAKLKFFDNFSNEDIKEIEEFSKKFSNYFSMVKSVFMYCKKANIDKIELNIFLSLYGRLYIEQMIFKKITKNVKERNILLSSIKTYQTGYLLKKYGNDVNINALNDYITKFIHINQGLSYLINIDSKILFKLINNIK